MTKAAHTAGPWTTDSEYDNQTVLGTDGIMVADCSITVSSQFGNRSDENNRANARLIAAAPDMLAALQMSLPALEWCQKQWADSPQQEGINVLAVVRAAIAKAEGGAS